MKSEMLPKERVKRAISFNYPDRIPISHAVLPVAQFAYGEELKELLLQVDEDFGWSALPDLAPENYPPQYKKGHHADGFGTIWYGEKAGICGIPKIYPLEDLDNLSSYEWPDFEVGQPSHKLYSGHVDNTNQRYYSRGGWIVFFEQAQQLRGFNQFMVDLALDNPQNNKFLDELLEFNLNYVDKWIKHGYDGLHFADDWGTQRALMISPDLWRKKFKPAYKEMFRKVRDAGLDVHFHSDGQIKDILPDLIEVGASVINCQAYLVGLDLIKKEYKGKVCFRTDLDRQHTMVHGTPEEVRIHIRDVFTHLGDATGGIIACGEIGDDTPIANIRAMYDEFLNFSF
ncbi:MAG: uroporphyrinogen decarboxylase family protein [Sphaerochaetaceae bacterium]